VRPYALAGALIALAAHVAVAQNPDLALSQAERDSLLKNYHNRFPIWGRKAIEKGFDLPNPVGVSVNLVYAQQDIKLSDLGLSTGSNPTVPVDFIKFGRVHAPVFTGNVRGDLWVLPFLNVYAMAGGARVTTDVNIAEPVQFNTKVDQNGQYAGLGMTGTMGIKHNWLAFDVNWAWTKTENLNAAVNTRIFGIRYGRAQKIGPTQRVAFWLGAMKQTLNSGTDGSIALSDVISGGGGSLGDYQNSAWYQGLTPAQKQIVDQIAERLAGRDPTDVTVNYALKKSVADPWNMLAGVSYDWSKRWQGRVETGFIGRFQVLGQINYRFGW
jgi:hypothetical protein